MATQCGDAPSNTKHFGWRKAFIHFWKLICQTKPKSSSIIIIITIILMIIRTTIYVYFFSHLNNFVPEKAAWKLKCFMWDSPLVRCELWTSFEWYTYTVWKTVDCLVLTRAVQRNAKVTLRMVAAQCNCEVHRKYERSLCSTTNSLFSTPCEQHRPDITQYHTNFRDLVNKEKLLFIING